MGLDTRAKKILDWLITPIAISAFIYAGIMWEKTSHTEKEIQLLKDTTVTKQLWQQTDKKIDKVMATSTNIEEKLDGIAKANNDDHSDIKKDLSSTKTKVAVLSQRVDTLEKQNGDGKEISYYMPYHYDYNYEDTITWLSKNYYKTFIGE